MLRIATGQLGIGRRQISTVNASVAMSIRADKRAVSLPRMPEKIETELATATGPAEDHWGQLASRVDPRTARAAAISDLGEVLRRDRTPTVTEDPRSRATASRPLGGRTSSPLRCRRSARDGLTDWLLKPSHHRSGMR